MKRALLLLPFLLFAGCSVDRKAYLEGFLVDKISQDMQRLSSPTNTNGSAVCKQVILVRESEGHYVGTVFFTDGRQTQIKLLDDGQNINYDVSPF